MKKNFKLKKEKLFFPIFFHQIWKITGHDWTGICILLPANCPLGKKKEDRDLHTNFFGQGTYLPTYIFSRTV